MHWQTDKLTNTLERYCCSGILLVFLHCRDLSRNQFRNSRTLPLFSPEKPGSKCSFWAPESPCSGVSTFQWPRNYDSRDCCTEYFSVAKHKPWGGHNFCRTFMFILFSTFVTDFMTWLTNQRRGVLGFSVVCATSATSMKTSQSFNSKSKLSACAKNHA